MNTDKILSIVKKKKAMLIDTNVSTDITVIIDYYNVYCNIIKFNKYKTFSRKTCMLCLNLLINKFKNYKEVIIVSKNIFEIELDYIKILTVKHPNIKYIIVEDLFLPKGENRERDDYVCLLTYQLLLEKNKKSVIVTNDKYKNYKQLLTNAKKLQINTYIRGVNSEILDISEEYIESKLEKLKNMCENNLTTVKFKFTT